MDKTIDMSDIHIETLDYAIDTFGMFIMAEIDYKEGRATDMSLDIWLKGEIDMGGPTGPESGTFYDANFTHNMVGLWRHIGVYEALYYSEGKTAADILPALEVGVDFMLERPDECRKYDAPNGWGKYDDALPWLQKMVDACRRYPRAVIRVSS